MFKSFIIPLILLVFGVSFTNFYKNKSKNLEEKIAKKKEVIYELRKSNELEIKDLLYKYFSKDTIQRLGEGDIVDELNTILMTAFDNNVTKLTNIRTKDRSSTGGSIMGGNIGGAPPFIPDPAKIKTLKIRTIQQLQITVENKDGKVIVTNIDDPDNVIPKSTLTTTNKILSINDLRIRNADDVTPKINDIKISPEPLTINTMKIIL